MPRAVASGAHFALALLTACAVVACAAERTPPPETSESAPSAPLWGMHLETDEVVRLVYLRNAEDNWFRLDEEANTLAIRPVDDSARLESMDILAVDAADQRTNVGGFRGENSGYSMGLKWTPRAPGGGFLLTIRPGGQRGGVTTVTVLASSWVQRETGMPTPFVWPDE